MTSSLAIPSSGHQSLSGWLTVTPITLTLSRAGGVANAERWWLELTGAPGAFRGILVVPQTQEHRLAQLAVGGPLGERDLRHELGPDPGDAGHAGHGQERRFVSLQGTHPCGQIRRRPTGEAPAPLGAEPAGRHRGRP